MAFKVTFIFYNNATAYSWSPAIQALSAYIKKHTDCETELLHLNEKNGISLDPAIIKEKIKSSKPDLIAFTSTSFGYCQVNDLAGQLKKSFPEIAIIAGGTHPTIKPEDLSDSNFDGFCIGEGEKPLLHLIRKMEKGMNYLDTPSFHFRVNGKIIKNDLEPFEENLNNFPPYDWDIFDTPRLLELRKGWLSLSISRGCPFSCNFCINSRIKEIVGSKNYVRQKSVDRTMEEILDVLKKFPIKVFNFEDDILIFNKKWTNAFLDRYKKEIYEIYNVKFKVEARVDLINEAIIRRLKESGCQEVQFGLETGNPNLRNFVLNKSISDEQIINAFDLCWKYGLNTLAFVMFGIPGETDNTVQDTIRILSKAKPYLIRPSFIYPIYGTEFYNYCKKNKLLKENIDQYKTYLWTEGLPIYLKDISEEAMVKYMVLLPWYINVELGLKEYEKLIEEYANKNFIINGKKEFKIILKLDESKSEELAKRNVSHYRYFNDELNYLQFLNF